MASRNKRRAKAKEREAVLKLAVKQAFALEASKAATVAKPSLAEEYPCFGESDIGKSLFRPWGKGSVTRSRDLPSTGAKLGARQSLPKPPESKPLKGDGHKNRGEIARTWLDAKPYRTKGR